MIKKLFHFMLLGVLAFSVARATAQSGISFDSYHTNKEVQQFLETLQKGNPTSMKLHNIATSPGGEAIHVLEIGSDLNGVPAVFVGANFEGNVPLATEGALYFAKMLLDSTRFTKNLKWYILPQANPDAASGFFAKTKYGRTVNDFAINNDVDEAVNEDGFDDLNGDGYITKMRVKDLEGTYIASKTDPRIMVKADASKGEKGEYKLYDEGIDNDNDGQYNEDGEGGINVGIGFPHLFPRDKKDAGLWAGQTPEVYNLMRFISDRPEIAMVFTLGNSDFCRTPPKGGRKGGANLQSLKIPARYAQLLNVDPNQTFSMEEVVEMMKQIVPPGVDVTSSMVAGMLRLGAAVNPLEEDLKFYTKLSEDYNKYLESKKFNTERLDAPGDKDGSFELWAYYHLGVPSFSMNLFTVPKVEAEKKSGDSVASQEEVEKMSPEKMAKMMKTNPKKEDDGELGEKDKALLAYADKDWEGKGFVQWQSYTHPTLGDVEIGGYIPYLETTPKPEHIDSVLQVQLPWLLQLSTKLPEILIADEKITELGGGIFKLELYIENKGYLPYPIAMGQRNSQPAPIVVILDGEIKFLEGIKRTPLGAIGGNSVKKLTWIIQADKKSEITAKIESTIFGKTEKQIKIGG